MKRMIIILLSLIPLYAMAQEPQIIGGYLLDGKDSFEELDAAVLTISRSREKNLDGKGMLIPGASGVMTPESLGKETGSLIQIKKPFLVRAISFKVDENRIEGCKAGIRIYRKTEDGTLKNIVTMPIHQDIPKTEKKTTFRIVPQESIELVPGEYYVSFALTEISQDIMDKWADSRTWDTKERYTRQLEDSMYFPVYVKSSYIRENSESPLTKWNYNIGMSVRGTYLKNQSASE